MRRFPEELATNLAEIDALLARDEEAPACPATGELPATSPSRSARSQADREQPGVTYAVTDADGEEHEYETPPRPARR